MVDSFSKWIQVFPYPTHTSGATAPRETTIRSTRMAGTTIYDSQFSRSVVSDSLRPHEPQHSSPPCPSPTPGVHPNPCPSNW